MKDVLRDWDPIGVIPELLASGLPPSEYDSCAPHILGMLQRGCGVEEITEHLEYTCEEPMGLGKRTPMTLAHNTKIAADLVAWWKSKQ